MKKVFYSNKRMGVAILSVLLCLCLAFPGKSLAAPTSESKLSSFAKKKVTTSINTPKPGDKVHVIVELDDEPLISSFPSKTYSTASEYIKSDAAKNKVATLRAKRNKVKKSINSTNIAIKYKWDYSVMLNGFSAELKYKDVEKLRKVNGVKRVILSRMFSVPEIQPNMADLEDETEPIDVTPVEDTPPEVPFDAPQQEIPFGDD